MNYTKAQKEVFDALCNGRKTGRFDIDANNVWVTPDGYRAHIFPKSLICFSLEKIPEMSPIPIKELIQDQYQLTLTPDLRIIDTHRVARRLKGDGKSVIGFAGWADIGNRNPLLRGFLKWCDYLAEGEETA